MSRFFPWFAKDAGRPLNVVTFVDLEIAWWQWVPFLEVGRVAPEWSLDTLHSDLKWDAGLGIRLLAKGIIVRIDTAVSEEGLGIAMMIYQPFQL